MIRRPPRSTPLYSSAASDVYKREEKGSGVSAYTVIGVDLGGTNARAGVVEGGRLTDVRSVAVRSQGSEQDVLFRTLTSDGDGPDVGETAALDDTGPGVRPAEVDADDRVRAHAASFFFFMAIVSLAMTGRAQRPMLRM